jgi:RimJ/RimL family protein N-acetyltransferase
MTGTIPNWQPDYLEDDKVRLVPLTENDFERLFHVASDPLIWEQHPSSDRYQRHVFQDFFDGALQSRSAFLIEDKSSGEIIGSSRYYDYDQSKSSIAIGWTFLARAYWGGEYNKSVKQLMINYAFKHVDKVIFHIGATNIRSQMATAKFGAVKTGELVKDSPTGQTLNFEYELDKASWQKSNKS